MGSKNRAVKSITGAIGGTSVQRAGGGKSNDAVRFFATCNANRVLSQAGVDCGSEQPLRV